MVATSSNKVAPSSQQQKKGGQNRGAKLNFLTALWRFMSMQWLGLGDNDVSSEMGSTIKDNFVNVGVVAALLFTMLALDTGSVGDELATMTNGTITTESCGKVYAFTSSLAMWSLFGAVLHSLYLYCQVSELTTPAEVYFWVNKMGIILVNFHFVYLIIGFILYIFAQLWLALTVLGLTLFIISAAFLLTVVALPLAFASTKSVQAMYEAKLPEVQAMYEAKLQGASVSA